MRARGDEMGWENFASSCVRRERKKHILLHNKNIKKHLNVESEAVSRTFSGSASARELFSSVKSETCEMHKRPTKNNDYGIEFHCSTIERALFFLFFPSRKRRERIRHVDMELMSTSF